MFASAETLVIREPCERGFAPPRLGSCIGAYELLELLGHGAIGLVYLAEHTKLKRRVALKVLRDELASNPKAVARFFGEARAVNEIAHDNIVEITDFVEADSLRGLPSHYIMELLEGRTLKERMEDDQLTIDQILAIGMQIADALAAVHEKQIVHRDLKPANIFLVTDDKQTDFVKLLDFGVAKLSSALQSPQPDTGSGVLIGTPGYMAPEQIQGVEIDQRTDVYALGVVLYEMVAGHPPFVEDDLFELLYKHCDADPPDLEEASQRDNIPRRLVQLIHECLKKFPEERPQSADEVYQRLRAMRDRQKMKRRLIPASWVAGLSVGAIALLGLGGKHDPPAVAEELSVAQNPAHVLLRIASDPPGAEVFLNEELLGHTPLAHVFEKSDRSEQFTFHLPGHEAVSETVSFDADVRLHVALKPIAEPRKKIQQVKVKRKKKSRISRAEIRNPFE